MPIQRTASRTTTDTLRERQRNMLLGLERCKMSDNDDLITHIIKFNNMLQEYIFEGNWIKRPDRYILLRNTLPEKWQMEFTDIWRSVTQTEEFSIQYNKAIEWLATEYLKHKAKSTIFPSMSRNRNHAARFAIGHPWLSKIDYQLPQEFKDSFPKSLICRDRETGEIIFVRY